MVSKVVLMLNSTLNVLLLTINCYRMGGRECMLVGFTTTYAISVYHH